MMQRRRRHGATETTHELRRTIGVMRDRPGTALALSKIASRETPCATIQSFELLFDEVALLGRDDVRN